MLKRVIVLLIVLFSSYSYADIRVSDTMLFEGVEIKASFIGPGGEVILSTPQITNPEFSLNATNSLIPERAVDGTPTFTRATTATVWGYCATCNAVDGMTILSVASGEARFYGARRISEGVWSSNFTDGSAIPSTTLWGFLSEGAKTTYILWSESFDEATSGAVWSETNLTPTANTIASPDGATTADTLLATNTDGITLQVVTATAVPWTFSVYLKRKTGTGAVTVTADSDATRTTCDLSGGGWVRCSHTVTLTAAAYTMGIKLATNTDAVYAWGAVAEIGSFATSYIKNDSATASVTRNADSLTYPATNYDATKGTALATLSSLWGTNGSLAVNAIDVGGSVGAIFRRTATATSNALSLLDGTTTLQSNTSTSFQNNPLKAAASWGTNGQAISYNGTTITTSAFDGTMGSGVIGIGGNWNGTLKNIRIWKKQLPNSWLNSTRGSAP